MKAEVIKNRNKVFIIINGENNTTIKVLQVIDSKPVTKIYNGFSDMPLAEYDEMLAAKMASRNLGMKYGASVRQH